MLGSKRLSTRAASKPFITGIERSKMIKSGAQLLSLLDGVTSIFCLTTHIKDPLRV
jgi:hypothetical protein